MLDHALVVLEFEYDSMYDGYFRSLTSNDIKFKILSIASVQILT